MTTARAVREIQVPPGTVIHATLHDADFFDAFTTTDPRPAASALQTWLEVLARTPRWTEQLLAVRNKLVRLVGLKGVGQLQDVHPLASGASPTNARSYRVGDRVGIFLIRHLSDTEVVMGQDDKHLDVQVSLTKHGQPGSAPTVVISTVVHIHNTLGHAYMAVITPFHRRIVQAMLQQLAASNHGPR
ncbi:MULTISPECIES: DUF2867 domain-containing protein [unclassified Acidovorax]|uniref:DUF2867 domain-containing protein n=1 Tax=unclassified Acidovorax TaxID=2684926 RepID=UPI001C43E60C|nr:MULTISPECIES: DUF2867 domain-containing protein [unclassified Acidovorax]MBV7430358.1 DUF2867 domain-containing protein [Acidovorax sp. sif0732]MBV7451751.1 DUF2867 domain-containing protein [Acidovorax sp. sif0715]